MQAAATYPNSETMAFFRDPKIEYAFKNYGKTPGIIREVSHGLIVNEGPPDHIAYMVTKHLFIENMIAAGKSTETQIFDGDPLFGTIKNAMPVVLGQAHFWFFGRFDYEDVFGNPQVHRFLMRLVKIGRSWGFQPYDHRHYNEST